MHCVGIDLHKRSLTVCVIDKRTGETFDERFACSQQSDILEFFGKLRPFEAVVEASATYEWLWLLLEPVASRLQLAHPKKIRVIAESMKKTDRHDAQFLAWLLTQDAVPQAQRPSPARREYLHLINHRLQQVRARAKIKTQIRSVLAARNLDSKAVFTAKGEDYLAELDLPAAERFRIAEMTDVIDCLDRKILSVDTELSKFRRALAADERKNHDLVKSVPGFGDVIADIVLASLGDISRFPSLQKVSSYSGLVPGFRESDRKKKLLGITKEGPRTLRWALVQAAWRAIRYSPYWTQQFQKLAKRRGKQKAIVAVARRLLGVVYSLLKNQTPYREKIVIPEESLRRRRTRAATRRGAMEASSSQR